MLTGGPRDLPPRQQTLRNAIAWSYDLLPPTEQTLFRRLAIFSGVFDLSAAEAMNWDRMGTGEHGEPPGFGPPAWLLDAVAMLLDHNLITRGMEEDGAPHFGMLETIREYGLERLEAHDEGDAARGRHLNWCLDRAERAVPALYTAAEAEALRGFDRDDGNHRAALAWAFGAGRGTDLEHGLRLAGALSDAWYLRGQLGEGQAVAGRGGRGEPRPGPVGGPGARARRRLPLSPRARRYRAGPDLRRRRSGHGRSGRR